MNETRQLAQWTVDTNYLDLPSSIIEAVRLYILDDLACGFAGATQPWVEIVGALARDTAHGGYSVFCHDWKTSAPYAALVNGVSIGGFEIDHAFMQGSCHPSAAVFPAVLAAAEGVRIDGRGFLTAVAVGYEALCRVGLAATRAVEDERGFHGPGTNAAIGAAFGASKAFGTSLDTTVNAVGIAGSHGGGLLEFFREGAMTKRLHVGRGAQLGLESTLLARAGFTGPSTVLEGETGFLNVYSPSPRPELLLDGLGERYLLLDMTLKLYPCHLSFHAVIDAIKRFRAEVSFEAAAVEAVTITASGRMMEQRFAEREPKTIMAAQYSLPWSAAIALTRPVDDLTSWNDRDLSDPTLCSIARGMRFREAQAREAPPEVRISIGGQEHVLQAGDWKGAPTNPCSFDDVAAKFRRYAEGKLRPVLIEEVIERVFRFEEEEDASKVIQLISCS